MDKLKELIVTILGGLIILTILWFSFFVALPIMTIVLLLVFIYFFITKRYHLKK